MDEPVRRRERRRQHVEQFLAGAGVTAQQLARSTHECLDQWARQVLLVQDQPSANWANVVLQLCRAVESELASTLGQMEGLTFLADGALGDKARDLARLDQQTKQKLAASGIKVGFLGELQRLLSELARLRRQTDAAHGAVDLQTATSADANRARQIAGTILKRLHSPPAKP